MKSPSASDWLAWIVLGAVGVLSAASCGRTELNTVKSREPPTSSGGGGGSSSATSATNATNATSATSATSATTSTTAGGAPTCEDDADCDPIAICTNFPGGFTCTCPPGYVDTFGDGSQCHDIDECTLQVDDCVPPDTCMNLPGSFACISPEVSCKAILDAGESVGDGVYSIDPDGVGPNAPFDVYCDMTQSGGGWTLVFNDGLAFDRTNPGDPGNICFSTNGNGLAFSSVPIKADVMLDAHDADIMNASYTVRTIILGVQPQLVDTTVFSLMNTAQNYYAELEDNSNVTNVFTNGDCNTNIWVDYRDVICGTLVLTLFDDPIGCGPSGSFAIGGSISFTSSWANCAGWPNDPNWGGTNYWPDHFRMWVR